MYSKITIVRKNKETKITEEYEFDLFDSSASLDLVLNRYIKSETKPRKVLAFYNRLSERSTTINEEDIIIPDDVREEARQMLIDSIRIIKWSEYKR